VTSDKPIPHGTHRGYQNHKCRCEKCTKANTDYVTKRRVKLRTSEKIPHGTITGYGDYSCRCDKCKLTYSEYKKLVRCSCASCSERTAKYAKKYQSSPLGKTTRNKQHKKWRDANQHKILAHRAVAKAIKSGDLVRPNVCEHCSGHIFTEASHTDYSQQLDVEWLCHRCHMVKDETIPNAPKDKIHKTGARSMYKALEAVKVK